MEWKIVSEMANQERSLLKSSQGGKVVVPLYSMVKDAVVYSNALSFFGPQLGTALILEPALDNTAYHKTAQDRVFLKAATDSSRVYYLLLRLCVFCLRLLHRRSL